MNNRQLQLAARVIAAADKTHPADAVLRQELKSQRGLLPIESRTISHLVNAFYRWRGWLDEARATPEQIQAAIELNERFLQMPERFPAEELMKHTVPVWIHEQMVVTQEWARALQSEPKLWLRARAGQGRALAEKLGDCRFAGQGPLRDALLYEGTKDLLRSPEFHAGAFEIQDLSSQMVGWICDSKPGETWWDACAGEGGKLLHLSDLMQNQGLIWASDRAAWRLKNLKRRAARTRVFNYRVTLWDSGAKLPMKTKFDGVLVDAPCSGVGTWHRNPHARWTTTLQDVQELAAVQRNLLERVADSVKPGGKLAYAVCTLTRAETTKVVAAFEKSFPEFSPLPLSNPLTRDSAVPGPLWLWPQENEGNGMFIAAWRRIAP